MGHEHKFKPITFPAGFIMNRCDCGEYKFDDPKVITHNEELLKDMDKNGVWHEEYHSALTIAVRSMEATAFTCTCGNVITAFCVKCGGYVQNSGRK
jgi:hypothetical protein